MLEDENTPVAKQIVFSHQVDDPFAAFQIIGGVGKNQVELLGATFQIEENIRLDRIEISASQHCGSLPDEVVVYWVDLYGRDASGASRGEFVADRTRSGEEVEYIALLEIDEVAQYVEQIFLGEIGRWPCAQVLGRIDRAPLVFPADYSHIVFLNRLRSLLPGLLSA